MTPARLNAPAFAIPPRAAAAAAIAAALLTAALWLGRSPGPGPQLQLSLLLGSAFGFELVDLFQQIAAVNLAGRLVVAGSHG